MPRTRSAADPRAAAALKLAEKMKIAVDNALTEARRSLASSAAMTRTIPDALDLYGKVHEFVNTQSHSARVPGLDDDRIHDMTRTVLENLIKECKPTLSTNTVKRLVGSAAAVRTTFTPNGIDAIKNHLQDIDDAHLESELKFALRAVLNDEAMEVHQHEQYPGPDVSGGASAKNSEVDDLFASMNVAVRRHRDEYRATKASHPAVSARVVWREPSENTRHATALTCTFLFYCRSAAVERRSPRGRHAATNARRWE